MLTHTQTPATLISETPYNPATSPDAQRPTHSPSICQGEKAKNRNADTPHIPRKAPRPAARSEVEETAAQTTPAVKNQRPPHTITNRYEL